MDEVLAKAVGLFNKLSSEKEEERRQKAVLLAPYSEMSHRAINDLGFEVGVDLLNTSRTEVLLRRPRKNSPGRVFRSRERSSAGNRFQAVRRLMGRDRAHLRGAPKLALH